MSRQDKIIVLKKYKQILETIKEEQISTPVYEKPKVKVLSYKYNGKYIEVA